MLKTLCMLDAASGREDAVRDFVLKNLPADATYTVDALGNIIAEKKGERRAKHKVALFAHMDEVALLITHITEDGFLRFETVGGIDARVLFGKAVRLESGAVGVIGGKAVHHLSKDERDKIPDVHALCIDIGAASREEAEKYAALGDNAYFCTDYTEFGDGFVKAKALDDRVGVAILLEMLQKPQPYDLTCCFTVQEEIGTRGAGAAAYTVRPDYAVVLECTTAADLADVAGHKRVCALGKGAVVGFMDRGTVYDRELYRLAFEIAEKNNLPCQTKTLVAGGNDAAAIHKAAGGIKTVAVSVPCRYIHAPSCVAKQADIESTAILAQKLAEALCNA